MKLEIQSIEYVNGSLALLKLASSGKTVGVVVVHDAVTIDNLKTSSPTSVELGAVKQ